MGGSSQYGQEEDEDQPRARLWLYMLGFAGLFVQLAVLLTVYYWSGKKKLEPLRTKTKQTPSEQRIKKQQ